MTPQCPKCKAVLKDDYGMVTCASCGAILFIDMDGIAQIYEDASSSGTSNATSSGQSTPAREATKTKITPPEPAPFEFASLDESADQPSETPLENLGETPSEFTPEDPAPLNEHQPIESFGDGFGSEASTEGFQQTEEVQYGASAEPQNEEVAESSHDSVPADLAPPNDEGGNFDMDALLGYGQQPQEEASSTEDQFGTPGDPLGLNAYANSELSSARDGLLLFKILISGIDSKELRESLREALEDARFAWNADQLMSSISKGALSIENVSPVKATILINRIKRLPVKIVWEQHAITQMDES